MELPGPAAAVTLPPAAAAWSYRVSDYRVVYEIRDDDVTVLDVMLGHRREIYELWPAASEDKAAEGGWSSQGPHSPPFSSEGGDQPFFCVPAPAPALALVRTNA